MAKKRFGQHFLTHPGYLYQLVASISPQQADHIVEIGPGRGALTDHLYGHCRHLTLIELDRDLIAALGQRYPKAVIYPQDVLTIEWPQLVGQGQVRLVGNLPYNISTPILFHCFAHNALFSDMHFLLQKEVVRRMIASPGSKHYGRLSVMTQFFCHAQLLEELPAEAFSPPPKVCSAFVGLTPRPQPLDSDALARFSAVVCDAFNARRKTIANALKHHLGSEHWPALGIDPRHRPQQLSVEDFVAISNYIGKQVD